MVSFTLDTVKFLLIYRHLQNAYWFKRTYYTETFSNINQCKLDFKAMRMSRTLKSLETMQQMNSIFGIK